MFWATFKFYAQNFDRNVFKKYNIRKPTSYRWRWTLSLPREHETRYSSMVFESLRIWTFCWESSMCRVQRFGISWRLSSLRLISKGRVRSFGRWPIGFFLRIEGHRCVRCGVRIAVWVFCVRSDAGAGVLWEIYLLVAILCSGSCQLIMHEVRRRSMFRVRRWWFVQGSSCIRLFIVLI